MKRSFLTTSAIFASLLFGAGMAVPGAHAQGAKPPSSTQQAKKSQCPVTHDQLAKALKQNVKASGGPDNGGLPVNEWAAVVDRHGTLCAIAFSGKKVTDQWLGSRAIAVEKANTVNAFGLDTYAISTANLWAQSQPGGFLFGAGLSNPPVAQELYAGDPKSYGTTSDPLLGKTPGGVIVFGGGLALYNDSGMLGGLGASGNTSCADHNIAWRIRKTLGLDKVPNGPSPSHNDAIVYDIGKDGKSESGWGHPECGHSAPQIAKQIGSGIVKVAQSVQPPVKSTAQVPHTEGTGVPQPEHNAAPQGANSPAGAAKDGNKTLPNWQR